MSSSLSASHLKNKRTTKHPPLQNKKEETKEKRKETETSPLWIQHTKPQTMLLIARYWFASVNKVQENKVKKNKQKKPIQQQSLKVKISVRYDIKQSDF